MKLDANRKVVISVSALAAIVVVGWQFHEWTGRHLNTHLMSRAEAQTLHMAQNEQIKQAADAAKEAANAATETARLLRDHIKGEELKSARERLNQLRGQLSETQLWESTNGGANDISRARKADLNSQIEVLSTLIACLEAGRNNCG